MSKWNHPFQVLRKHQRICLARSLESPLKTLQIALLQTKTQSLLSQKSSRGEILWNKLLFENQMSIHVSKSLIWKATASCFLTVIHNLPGFLPRTHNIYIFDHYPFFSQRPSLFTCFFVFWLILDKFLLSRLIIKHGVRPATTLYNQRPSDFFFVRSMPHKYCCFMMLGIFNFASLREMLFASEEKNPVWFLHRSYLSHKIFAAWNVSECRNMCLDRRRKPQHREGQCDKAKVHVSSCRLGK